jgi:hypothetical protein
MKTRKRTSSAAATDSRHGTRKLCRLLPSWETLRLAACALTRSEWKAWMRDLLFQIDTGVRDGAADNKRLWMAYAEGTTPEGAR